MDKYDLADKDYQKSYLSILEVLWDIWELEEMLMLKKGTMMR